MSTSFPDRQNQVFYLFTMGGLQNQVFPDLQNVYVPHGGFVSLAQLGPHVQKNMFSTLVNNAIILCFTGGKKTWYAT